MARGMARRRRPIPASPPRRAMLADGQLPDVGVVEDPLAGSFEECLARCVEGDVSGDGGDVGVDLARPEGARPIRKGNPRDGVPAGSRAARATTSTCRLLVRNSRIPQVRWRPGEDANPRPAAGKAVAGIVPERPSACVVVSETNTWVHLGFRRRTPRCDDDRPRCCQRCWALGLQHSRGDLEAG